MLGHAVAGAAPPVGARGSWSWRWRRREVCSMFKYSNFVTAYSRTFEATTAELSKLLLPVACN